MKESFYDRLNFQISFSCEMVPGNGEDSHVSVYSDNKTLNAVFDGCGGLGAKEYSALGNKTGAYIAAREMCRVTSEWFEKSASMPPDVGEYKALIKKSFSELNKYECKENVCFKGSMKKSFPTTASALISYDSSDGVYSLFVWAGDSRGYILDENGLHQVTKDDIKDEDAMSNLKNDGILTNVINSDTDFQLRLVTVKINKPMILFCATDGCFGYLSTPMEFEHLLLETMEKSNSPDSWEKCLTEEISRVTGDDFSMSLISFGYDNFKALKKKYLSRKKFIEQKFINKLTDMSYDEKLKLWNEYKKDYEYKIGRNEQI